MKTLEFADACICCGRTNLASSPAVLMPFVAARALGQEPVEITADWGLRDLRPGVAYTLCHSLQCRACGVLFLDIRFTSAQMAALYQGYRDAQYTQQRDRFEPGYAATMARDYTRRHAYIADVERWLQPHLPAHPRVLDWGGGDGSNTPFLGRGIVHVHDISGAPLAAGAERAGAQAKHSYDLVVCMQVLEHVADPLAVLQEIRPALAPDTLLYLEVPHEALVRRHPHGTDLAPYKRHWHEHVNFFTQASLRQLAQGAGLRVLDTLFLSINNGARQAEVMGLLLTKNVSDGGT